MKTKLFTFAAALMFGLFFTNTASAQLAPPSSDGTTNGTAQPALEIKIQVRAFPSPASESITIATTLPKNPLNGDAVITISNASGSILYNKTCSDCGGKSEFSLDIKSFPAGLYFVRLSYAGRNATGKFLKVD